MLLKMGSPGRQCILKCPKWLRFSCKSTPSLYLDRLPKILSGRNWCPKWKPYLTSLEFLVTHPGHWMTKWTLPENTRSFPITPVSSFSPTFCLFSKLQLTIHFSRDRTQKWHILWQQGQYLKGLRMSTPWLLLWQKMDTGQRRNISFSKVTTCCKQNFMPQLDSLWIWLGPKPRQPLGNSISSVNMYF